MKKIVLMAAVVSAAFIGGPASAETYFGGGVGQARTDGKDTSWKAYAGFQLSPLWGLEVAYTDLGSYRGADIASWSLAGTATVPLGERWSLLGKVGASANHPKFAGASNHTDLLLGVGVGYSLSKNLGLRLEYEDFGKLSKASTGNNSRGNNLGLSLKYAFF